MAEPTDSNRKEVLRIELDLHKTEFSALRDEILHTMDGEKQALNLSLVAAAGGLSVISFIDKQSVYTVLLVLPFVFHVILWEMLNSIKTVSRVSSYLSTILIPRVNEILVELGSPRKDGLALGWEVYTAKESMNPGQVILTSLTPTRHWMPILAVAGLLVAYSLIAEGADHTPTITELVLILLNLALLIWAAVQNIVTLRTYMRKTRIPVVSANPMKPESHNSPKPPARVGKSKK